jgi:predicted esterase
MGEKDTTTSEWALPELFIDPNAITIAGFGTGATMAEQAWFAFSDTFKSSILFQGSIYAGTTVGYGKKSDSESFGWNYKLPTEATTNE